MKKKRHAPITQLREVAKEARRILIKRGIHTKESSIDRILGEKKIILPGIPAYLPHRWTLIKTRVVMRDLLVIWIEKTKGEPKKQENISQFFSFINEEMGRVEQNMKKDVDSMSSIIKAIKGSVMLTKIFKPIQDMETVHAVWQFIFDSMAVAVVVKSHHSTTDFSNWFLDWTHELEKQFVNNEEKK